METQIQDVNETTEIYFLKKELDRGIFQIAVWMLSY